jgi:hypothetical protein
MNSNKNKNRNRPTNNANRPRPNSSGSNKPINAMKDKVQEITNKVMETAKNLGGKINNSVTDIKQKITNTTEKASERVTSTSTAQEATKAVGKVQEFMEANSAISKFVAVVLSILVFYMLFNIGVYVLSQYFMPTTHAKVIDGLTQSNVQLTISSNPNVSKSVPILRSVNQSQGLEFTWDFWFFIKDTSTLKGYGLIFSKGLAKCADSDASSNTCKPGSSLLGVCPGAYITTINNQAQLLVAMNTLIDPSLNNIGYEELTIQDIPLNKWVHCAIRVQNVAVDVYINGIMTQRKILQTLPLQNYYDTYVGDQYSFNGYIASLNYYAYALNYDQIQNDYVKGPNMNLYGESNKINYKDYLAMNWYYNTK